jgi:nucleoside diphosphate kinase
LTREEVLNLFQQYRNAPFFSDIQEHMMTAESVVLLLTNAKETIPSTVEGEEDIKLESPIVRWKKLLGDKDPAVAKTDQPETLRSLFGTDLIKNGFWGSDDAKSANKERDIFLFPIPERPPEFEFVRTKVTMDMILSFLFPPNLEHANSTGRLDLFAMYGPVVKYHSVDYCFCKRCVSIAKEQLQISIRDKEASERKKMGLSATNMNATSASMGAGKVSMRGPGVAKTVLHVKKLTDAPTRLLKESDILAIQDRLCDKCREHCEGFVHLTSGRGGQHLMNDIEISELIR